MLNADEHAPARGAALAAGNGGALRSEALVEEASAPACVLDSQGRVIVTNRALEALGRIRAGEATQRLPVVVLTSSERPEDREEALRLGATTRCRHRRGRDRFAGSVSA